MTGDDLSWTSSDYWTERYFLDRAMEEYNGSIYIIQGMQDWNVDPHMAFPTHQIAIDHGFDVKGWYGQWKHDYPDRPDGHDGELDSRGRYDGTGPTICWNGSTTTYGTVDPNLA